MMSQYFLQQYKRFGGNVKVELYLSNYETKVDWKWATGFGTSKVAAKSDLATLNVQVDKFDVGKLKIFLVI